MANSRVYWLHALSPTHAGVGRGLGYIDLPIDRDGVTNWPLIRGSAFKGVWADYYGATAENRKNNLQLRAAFGVSSDTEDNASNSGSLIPTDARLVCLPVRSFRGTFAWCGSALSLGMRRRTLELTRISDLPPVSEKLASVEHVFIPDGEPGSALVESGQVYLEDLNFSVDKHADAQQWAERIAQCVFPEDTAWQGEFIKRFAVLPDVVFDYLTVTGTEVHTRVRISDDTKTVASGALWTEESLPAETILAGVVACDRVFAKNGQDITPDGLLDAYASGPLDLQIGGKATVGRGQMRCVFTTNSN